MASATIQPATKYAALYIRVSTADQGDRYSPGSQKIKLLEKARTDGYQVRAEHIFTDSHTGKETKRPEFERLRRLVKSGAVQAVFILGVDRLARKVVDAAIVAGEFKRHGAILDFVEMKNDDSPEGRFTFNMLASVAEYMGEKIVEKGRDGSMRMAADNRVPGCPMLFGHDRHPTEKGRRIKNEKEAAIALKMARMIDAGDSSYAVAAWLNQEGILTKGANGKKPTQWSAQCVRQYLRKRSLIGECLTRGHIVDVPRILSDDLYYRIQKRLTENANRAGRSPGVSLLSHFLKDEHGHPMCARARTRSYVCNHRTNKPPIKVLCDFPQVPAVPLENASFHMIWVMVTEPERLKRAARAYHQHRQPAGPVVSTRGIERELATAKRAYNNLRGMCESGVCEFEEKKAELLALKRRISSLECELRAVAPVFEMPDERAVEALIRRADISEEPEDFASRRAILEDLEDLEVIYYRSGEFEITGKVPVGPEAAAPSKCKGSNWKHGQADDTNSVPASIPFYLKGRVA